MAKKYKPAAISISLIFLILLIVAFIYIYPLYDSNKILNNVFVNETDIGNLSKEQAINHLSALHQQSSETFLITLIYNQKSLTIKSNDLNYDYAAAIEAAVNLALQYGHAGTLAQRISANNAASKKTAVIHLNLLYDDTAIFNMLMRIESELILPVNPDAIIFSPDTEKIYSIDDLISLSYMPQQSVQNQSELDNLNSYLDSVFEYNLDAPVYEINIEITLAEILKDLSDDNIAIVELIVEERDNYYSIDELKNRTTLVYHSSSGISKTSTYERDCNVATALNRFDGYILYPGCQLSFNEIALETSVENGYMIAPGISGGPLTFQGITQAATVILNAAIMSGCDIIERHSHSYPVYTADDDYPQCGLDAYVEWGEKDLIVKNNSDYPIYFDTYVYWNEPYSASYAYCNVYTMPLSDGQKYIIESILEFEGEMPETVYTEIANENELPNYIYEIYRDDNLGKIVYTSSSLPRPKRIYGVYIVINDDDGLELFREKLYDAVYEEMALEAFLLPIPEE